MTEYEIATLWLEIGNSKNLTFATYSTAFTAFVAATYFFAEKLPTWTLALIVLIYSVVMFSTFSGSISYYIFFDHLRAEFLQLPRADVGAYLAGVIGYDGGPGNIRYVLTSITYGASYFGSLLFLVSVVRKKNRDSET